MVRSLTSTKTLWYDLLHISTKDFASIVHFVVVNGCFHYFPDYNSYHLVLLSSSSASQPRPSAACFGGDVSLCEEVKQYSSRLQSTEEGRIYQQCMTGEQHPTAKKARSGPTIMMQVSNED